MELAEESLVKVATGGPEIDGIVAEILTGPKVVVAVMDRKRGPVLRTFQQTALTERTDAGPGDRALLLLIRRTPHSDRGSGRGGTGAAAGGRAGHTRSATHRPTGR